jgi:broad specificity phosphatase PhoE
MKMSKETADVPSTSRPSRGTLFLLRHGVISSEGGRRYIGWQDLALSDVGLAQARRWADYFSGAALTNIFCSDLARCLETARIIGARCSLEPKAVPEFREIRLGAWDGRRFETIQSLYPEDFKARGAHIADHRPPGGESFHDLQDRVWPVFKKIVQRLSGPTLIVTHAGVIRVLLSRMLGMPLENLFAIGQDHGALNIIDVRPENWRIQAMNLRLDGFNR